MTPTIIRKLFEKTSFVSKMKSSIHSPTYSWSLGPLIKTILFKKTQICSAKIKVGALVRNSKGGGGHGVEFTLKPSRAPNATNNWYLSEISLVNLIQQRRTFLRKLKSIFIDTHNQKQTELFYFSTSYNVCSVKKDTKPRSNTLLRLVSFFTEQTLMYVNKNK